MKRILIAVIMLSSFTGLFSQTTDICVTSDDMKLYNLIMDYRAKYKLPKIPLSKSLSYVAHQHIWDLNNNNPVKGNCNMHSWSDKGNWTACCYTSDHAKASCMWDKPRELSAYKGDGFEIASGGSGVLTPEEALSSWQGSTSHNDVILNKDIWKDFKWNAIGVAISGSYAVVWFGNQADAEGEPEKCK